VVDVELDKPTLARIADAAGLRGDQEIAAAVRGGRVAAASSPLSGALPATGGVARTVDVGGASYRVVVGALPSGTDTRLAVLESTDSVDSAASSIRDRILFVGLLVLAAVLLMAYLLAPAIGRARFAQQQRAVAERVLAHVADGVMLLDEQGTVRFWNRAAERLTGLTSARVVGFRAEEAIPGWHATSAQIPVIDADADEGVRGSGIVPLEIESRELWLAASGVRFSDGTVYSFTDISEDERLDRAKSDFVATVSHELRTPLASVYGAALTLQQRFSRLEKPQRDRLLELIAEESDRLSTIIDDILLASRLDAGELRIEQEQFDAEQVARAVVQAAQVRAPAGITVELSTPPWLPEASGDSDKLSQVLANLVENAVKYSPDGGRVDVVLVHRHDSIRFEVRDEGLGIPLDEQERIFKKFYRLDPNLTRGIGGTGLGLYICHELVRRMGGEIHVSSAPGDGSTFSFELPVAQAPDRVAVGTA
jgi:two-component system phosphate regulon sensor histidine kinase PhoR